MKIIKPKTHGLITRFIASFDIKTLKELTNEQQNNFNRCSSS